MIGNTDPAPWTEMPQQVFHIADGAIEAAVRTETLASAVARKRTAQTRNRPPRPR
ncbi:MAG: hypothetical protein WDN49_22120 [Acetobacteraceae bacterium]